MRFTAGILTFAALAGAAQAKCVTSYGSQSLSSVPTIKSSTTVTTTKVLTSTLVPTSTVTPAPVTQTTTKTKTKNVSTVTGSTITDTVDSTVTVTTSTSFTTFVASTSTVVVTTTSAETSITIPTAPGFTGVGDYLAALGHTYSKKKKRNALAYDAPAALVGRATSGFPVQVSCKTTVRKVSISTLTVTGSSTSTVTAPAKTKTVVITSTVTATKTNAPVHVTTTSGLVTTTITTTSIGTIEVLAAYTTTTTTILASSTTVYAACTGTYNLVSAVDGGMITSAQNLHGSYSTSDASAFDCCNRCQSLGADCWTGGFYQGTCWLNPGDGTGVCSADSFNGDFYYCAGCAPDGVSAVTVFNSACGRTEFGGDAQ